MQCVVLAGGLGTRMSRLTRTIPKALIPVAGEPFLRRQLRVLEQAGIDDVVIATGYLGEMIEDEVRSYHGSMSVRCVPDGPELLGTAGAILRLLEMEALEDQFMVTYGDSFLLVDYGAVWDDFDLGRFRALMTVWRNDDELDASNVVLDGDRVSLYRKGVADPAAMGMLFVDFGLSILTAEVIADLVPAGREYDLAFVFERLSIQSTLQGYLVADRFFEIGSERGLADLEMHLSERHDEYR